MSGRRIAALVAFVVGLAAAMLAYLHSRPVVSESELAEALVEVERIRVSLDDIECERPAILGPPSQDALPLEDFVHRDGPFAECWEAVGRDEVQEYLRGRAIPEGFRFRDIDGFRVVPLDRPLDPGVVDAVLSACAALPDEVSRQARTPNRCTPSPPSSEGWRRMQTDPGSEQPKNLMGPAIIVITRFGGMSSDAQLRFLVQGMATARDFAQGPSGILATLISGRAERRLAANFVEQLQVADLSPGVRAELSEALGKLAEMPVDMHALLASERIAVVDDLRTDSRMTPFSVYAMATILPRMMDTCPVGVSVEACLSRLPYPEIEVNYLGLLLFGRRYVREDLLQQIHSADLGPFDHHILSVEGLRENARALQRILLWDAERAEGQCPEISSWDPGADAQRFFVDRYENTFQLVTPGAHRHAFYFRCPSDEAL